MAQWLRIVTVVTEDPSLAFSTHVSPLLVCVSQKVKCRQSPCYDGSAYIFLILQWWVTCTQWPVSETHTPDLNSDRSLSWWDAADHLPRCWSKAVNRHPMSDNSTLHSRSCRAGQSGCYCIEWIFNQPFSVHGSGFIMAVWILNIPQRSL